MGLTDRGKWVEEFVSWATKDAPENLRLYNHEVVPDVKLRQCSIGNFKGAVFYPDGDELKGAWGDVLGDGMVVSTEGDREFLWARMELGTGCCKRLWSGTFLFEVERLPGREDFLSALWSLAEEQVHEAITDE